MPTQRFLIAPPDAGLVNNVKPWLIPDSAFTQLNNAYVFRGRVKKRPGTRVIDSAGTGTTLKSRLRVNIGTTDAVTGNFSVTVPGSDFGIGQSFSIGSTIFNVYQNGPMRSTGSATGTYNTATGAVAITGNNTNPLTDVFFYPGQPVLSLSQYEPIPVGTEKTMAFDQQFAYFYSNGWGRITGGDDTWTGSFIDYYWTTNYRGPDAADRFYFITNNTQTDGIRYYDGATFTKIAPFIRDSGDTLVTAKLLVSFKNRLLALNTVETTVMPAATERFPNRLRFSQIGNPVENSALDIPNAAWNENSPGKGGSIDAPTTEEIITASLIKDRLIVYFEESVYEVVFTGNEVQPFLWQQLNSELGAGATFSIVSFDKQDLSIGNAGIIGCNGVVVERIDANIPDEIFNIIAQGNILSQIYGVRDYIIEQAYWALATIENNPFPIYPNRILCYNYITGTWALFNDTVTSFGYFQESTNNFKRQVIGGNQQGYTFMIDRDVSFLTQSFTITNIVVGSPVTITSISHNLFDGDFVYIQNVTGISNLNGNIFKVTRVDFDNFTISAPTAAGTYTGGGTYAQVPKIDIFTKQYNFFTDIGQNMANDKVDFFIERTDSGALTIDYFASSSTTSLLTAGTITGSLIGTGVLETSAYATVPFEATQDRLWHSIYPQVNGESIQLRIYSSDTQMTNPIISLQPFELHGMLFYVSTTSFRFE